MAEKSKSKTIPLLALFIGILCLYFPVTTTAAAAAESDAAVDFFYLTLMWPGTRCYQEKCCLPTTDEAADEPVYGFLIEDMQTYDSRTPEIVKNCNTTCDFSVNKLAPVIPELYRYWCDLSCPCNNGKQNWNHTWCTYGKCSALGELNYTQAALNITERANLLEVFNANGIEPSYSTSYKRREIETALMANLGLATHVECVNNTDGTSLLSKIHICVSADGQGAIECPYYPISNDGEGKCGNQVFFYPFSRDELHECDDDAAGRSDGLIKMATEKDLAM